MECQLFTIGFTRKSAREFFTLLRDAGVRRVIDVRLNNNSQLAGFSKKDDLAYFLHEVGSIEYLHLPELTPTQQMLDEYRQQKEDWTTYEHKFLDLLAQRKIENRLSPELLDRGCLLCSEHLPHHCHRRLIAEYLGSKWSHVSAKHLV